ncbi:enoyl-CoA hydratase/isomerase family protein [Vibrio sp. S4M6]|uniref:enoyl-CoA hydratase/isomerase family protein n=1 Tax=Vibrio sinus TaxID=2946865 RepID=UPI002029CE36|nr:enoyl-CoA hydratase/isomerase family protein [Vibrio sinus]MCL9781964.1 enoyl-CoA hydratase/isomerase family protein [Vibrio sinus]
MTDNVRFERLPCENRQYSIGVVTLDNPSSLNALTYNMLDKLNTQLEAWQTDDSIVCVFLQGEGEKAFCAGGDVRTMYRVMKEETAADTQKFCTEYFTLEYQCDYLIHTYAKPVIAWGDGIVMGGGMGLFMGASHKVVTEKSRLAMPEVSIGLYPDVGGTWFLNQLEPGVGLFLGLTGASINAKDAIEIEMADYFVHSEQKQRLLDALMRTNWQPNASATSSINSALLELSQQAIRQIPQAKLLPYLSQICSACSGNDLDTIVEKVLAMETVGTTDDKWLQGVKSTLKDGSPITAHICYRQVTQYQSLSLEDCFRLELNLSVKGSTFGEFQEGVRARLIDKDGKPNWKFSSVMDVDTGVIDSLFDSLWSVEEHPLKSLGA